VQISISLLIAYTLSVTLVAFAGGVPPVFWRWNDRQLHLFVAFGAGTILGAIFLHLIPDSLGLGAAEQASAMILTGFIFILLIERILIRTHVHDPNTTALNKHRLVGVTALVGLSVHSLIGGFGLAVGMTEPAVGLAIFIAIIMHKATEAFSLSTIFRLAQFSRRRMILLLAAYSLMTPVGAIISLPFVRTLQHVNLAVPTGLTAGTFLYVATLDLIPEAFHGAGGKSLPFLLMVVGIVIMYLIKFFGA
jgi:zinc transporter ZupT